MESENGTFSDDGKAAPLTAHFRFANFLAAARTARIFLTPMGGATGGDQAAARRSG